VHYYIELRTKYIIINKEHVMSLQLSVLVLFMFVVIIASITLPTLPYHYCSAFQIQTQQPQRSYSHSRINNNHFLRNNIKTMMSPQPKSTPTTIMPVDTITDATTATATSTIATSIVDSDNNDNEVDSSSPFELFRNYVESMSSDDNIAATATTGDTATTTIKYLSTSASTTFTCKLVPCNNNDDGMDNSVITEINTLIFRPIISKEEESKSIKTEADNPSSTSISRSTTMPIYAVAIVPSSKQVDVKNFSYELSRIKIKKTKQINEEEESNNINDNDLYTSYDKWALAPSHTVKELCGFVPGTIPPILTIPTTTEATTTMRVKPFATIVDGSLLEAIPSSTSSSASNSNITATGESNNDKNISNNNNTLLLLGGGGNINYRCLIDSRFLIEKVLGIDTSTTSPTTTSTSDIFTTESTTSLISNNKANSNKIANIVKFDGSGGNNKPAQQATPGDNNFYKYNTKKKPYFPIGPPGNNNLLQRQQLDQEPHIPVSVTTIGRLTSVRQIAKQLVFADLAPPDYNYQYWLKYRDYNSNNNISNQNTYYKRNATDDGGGMPGPPWRSGEDGQDMYVQIIVGKTFCEKYGTERLKKELKPGRLILIKGAANVDPMQKNGWKNSVGNWATKRSLDVIVSSFEILNENENDDDDDEYSLYDNIMNNPLLGNNSNNDSKEQQQSNWNSLLPWERKHDYERRAVAGGSLENDAIDPASSHNVNIDTNNNILTLDRFNTNLRGTPLKVNIVDTDESIKSMSNHIRELSLKIEENNNNNKNNNNGSIGSDSLLKYVAGIDCEWRPIGAYAEAYLDGPDDNPVALLQICIPAIDQVFLVDTHRTIRANLAETESMTSNEEILSETIGAIFGSDEIIKVGYSVAIDFRRLAGSFPHISAFRNVRSVVELSTLAKRLHPSSSLQHSFGSLQRLTKLVLGYTISKEEQCSNWEARPLTPDQIEYSTLDCALPPRLLDEMAEGSGTAKMKEILPQVTSSWRFQTLNGSDHKDAIRLLKAKRAVGNTFVVSQSWLQGKNAPAPTSVPQEGGGPYTDKNGVLQMPAHFVSFAGDGGDGTNKEEAKWKKMTGKKIGKSKSKCIDLLVDDILPAGASLEYNPRSGYVAFKDGLALFVNLPGLNPSRRMPYPNEWIEDGQILTWYIRKKDWDDGKSDTAKLLGFSADITTTTELSSTNIILFTRAGNEEFVCCGKCTASIPDDDDDDKNAKLVKLHLHLNDWDTMKDSNDFAQILVTKKIVDISHGKEVAEDFSPSLQERLSLMVLAGNMIGALSMALDDAKKSPTNRSITTGVSCLRKIFTISSSSDDPLVLRALEILDKTMTND
jgi:hypothetical protein